MEKFKCKACKSMVEISELQDYPHICSRCKGKHAAEIYAAQAESIKFWQQTCEPGAATRGARRDRPNRQWPDSIERGLRKLGL
jgi:hypothetical protein